MTQQYFSFDTVICKLTKGESETIYFEDGTEQKYRFITRVIGPRDKGLRYSFVTNDETTHSLFGEISFDSKILWMIAGNLHQNLVNGELPHTCSVHVKRRWSSIHWNVSVSKKHQSMWNLFGR